MITDARYVLPLRWHDDVRYTAEQLERLVGLLADADLVRPQNYFAPLPWHARWDTGRILLNRALGADYPGTLGVRRSRLLAAGGHDGDVLFENLELMRTLRAVGGREVRAGDLCVRRLPPTARHFAGQRIRQAYDDLAQPARLAAVGAARWGRRGAEAAFGRSAPLWAPVWALERAVCVWLAVGCRLRGGVPYAGARLKTAAHSMAELRRRGRRGGTDGRVDHLGVLQRSLETMPDELEIRPDELETMPDELENRSDPLEAHHG